MTLCTAFLELTLQSVRSLSPGFSRNLTSLQPKLRLFRMMGAPMCWLKAVCSRKPVVLLSNTHHTQLLAVLLLKTDRPRSERDTKQTEGHLTDWLIKHSAAPLQLHDGFPFHWLSTLRDWLLSGRMEEDGGGVSLTSQHVCGSCAIYNLQRSRGQGLSQQFHFLGPQQQQHVCRDNSRAAIFLMEAHVCVQ